jgi:hypothetical protein
MTGLERLTDDQVRELMGHEPTPRGWTPLEVAEEHRATGLTAGQWRRFAFITTRGWAALPDAGCKTFALAACLGKMLNRNGTYERIRHGDEASCVVVRPIVRDRVLTLQGRGQRRWREEVVGWVGVGMAHRCADQPRGTVVLFFEPHDDCPACGAPVDRAAVRAPDERRPERRTSAVRAPQIVPIAGDASRAGKGDVALALGSPGSSASTGSTTSAPRELIDDRERTP